MAELPGPGTGDAECQSHACSLRGALGEAKAGRVGQARPEQGTHMRAL